MPEHDQRECIRTRRDAAAAIGDDFLVESTDGIVGMPEAEALSLLDDLLEHATQPRYQYRHRWHAGDLVMWDNRSLLHKANGDYEMSQLRYLYRVMLKGDVPV